MRSYSHSFRTVSEVSCAFCTTQLILYLSSALSPRKVMTRQRAVLITGQPGCGKTVLVRHLFDRLSSHLPEAVFSGFVTDEFVKGTRRCGFDVVTIPGGARGILARHDLKSKFKTGAYGVDVASFESIALPQLSVTGDLQIVIIDEIGRMEMHSKEFGCRVEALLGADNVYLVGSVAAPRYGHTVPLAEQIKARDDVTVIHMKKSTREEARQTAEASA